MWLPFWAWISLTPLTLLVPAPRSRNNMRHELCASRATSQTIHLACSVNVASCMVDRPLTALDLSFDALTFKVSNAKFTGQNFTSAKVSTFQRAFPRVIMLYLCLELVRDNHISDLRFY